MLTAYYIPYKKLHSGTCLLSFKFDWLIVTAWAYADDVNVLEDNIGTIKKNKNFNWR
jgi:hypothetical protein